jgi:hypothetical protein
VCVFPQGISLRNYSCFYGHSYYLGGLAIVGASLYLDNNGMEFGICKDCGKQVYLGKLMKSVCCEKMLFYKYF